MNRSRNRRLIPAALLFVIAFPALDAGARKARLELEYSALELPGAPSAILPADLDGDGRQDLVVAVAFTEWHQIGIEEEATMDDVGGLVEVLTIVPSLIDRRELRVYLAVEGGGYRALEPLELDRSVLSLEVGPPGLPIVALTDDGVSALRLAGEVEPPALEPLLAERPILAGTGTFIPDLGLTHDLDGDGAVDLLVPVADGAAVYLSRGGGFEETPAARLPWPRRDEDGDSGSRWVRYYPLPEARDVDGDGLADLLLRGRDSRWRRFWVLRSEGGGRFGPAVALGEDEDCVGAGQCARPDMAVVYFGDLDLITLTLDFSLMQAVKIMATRRVSIGIDFHLWCQDGNGRFLEVRGLDLSGKFRLDLDDLRIGQLSQFAGDFDADGKADFVQMGRGRDVTIHRGREGCVYPPEPDLAIRLEEEPADLKLVRVRDFDGDGRTDLIVIQPQRVTEPGVTPPVRLDMYLSGGAQ